MCAFVGSVGNMRSDSGCLNQCESHSESVVRKHSVSINFLSAQLARAGLGIPYVDFTSTSLRHQISIASPMECNTIRAGLRRAITSDCNLCKRRIVAQPRRFYATPTNITRDLPTGDIRAAAPIQFTSDPDQFEQPRAELVSRGSRRTPLLRRVRIVPASPSYFTATPRYTDDFLHLSSLVRKYELLPKASATEAPRVAWKTLDQYKTELGEPVRQKGYALLVTLLKRLNLIHPSLLPVEVERALMRYKRRVQPHLNLPKPTPIDDYGRARAVGRRKCSHAVVFLVEGEGECLINGRTLTEYFGRLHDRESAMWPLQATQRLDKYNIWAIAKGGGTTGQAEAITLGLAKALMVHEPDLKPALRKAGVIIRDTREVERKKHGKLKARKMPAWVKR